MTGPLVDPDSVPPWLGRLTRHSATVTPQDLARGPGTGARTGRPAAVLALFGQDDETGEPDLLLVRRSDGLTAHAGQVALPGGALDEGDRGPVEAALREAAEEVGVRPGAVRPVALLPQLHLPVSGFLVTPVLAHWQQPGPVAVVDPAETAAVTRAPLPVLADPAHRLRVRSPSGGAAFPAFTLPGMLVWGFTAGLVHALLAMGGWERPWETGRVHDLDAAWRLAGSVVEPSGDDPGESRQIGVRW